MRERPSNKGTPKTVSRASNLPKSQSLRVTFSHTAADYIGAAAVSHSVVWPGTVETSGNESSGMLEPILIKFRWPPSLSFLIRQKTSDPDQRAGTSRIHKLPTAAIAT
jgi:hypothetical protein